MTSRKTTKKPVTRAKKVSVKKVGRGRKKTAGKKAGAKQPPPPVGNRPTIQMHTGELSDIANITEKMLIDAGVPLYVRGENLVRPIVSEVDASHGRKTKVAQLATLTTTYMRDLMCRNALWEKWDKRTGGWARTVAPIAIASILINRNGDWKFPTLVGVVSTPTLRPDGSLLVVEGYDPATRLLLVAPPSMPTIPDKPGRDDALKALEFLKELLVEFPFVDDVSRAVALSAILTPIARGAYPVAPLHVARAPIAGSGKSYLFDTVSAIAIGQLMPVMAMGPNEEELEKRLGAALMGGQPLISIDNCNAELGGDALCQAIERPVVEIRILGKSERVRIEARGTSLFASGNNLTLTGDTCRRAITVNLDPRVERPELRQFDHDPVGMVLSDRGQYIAAALTIVRAYIMAGRPDRAPKLASFEDWSDSVRSALLWLGEDDPVQSMEAARESDPQRAELVDMISIWADELDIGYDHRTTLNSLIDQAEKTTQGSGGLYQPEYPELLSILQQVTLTKRGQKLSPLTLSAWLRKNKGKIVDNKRFANEPNPKSASTWWVEEV